MKNWFLSNGYESNPEENVLKCSIYVLSYLYQNLRNIVLRTMSFAIMILNNHYNKLNSFGAIEDKNIKVIGYRSLGYPKGTLMSFQTISSNCNCLSFALPFLKR